MRYLAILFTGALLRASSCLPEPKDCPVVANVPSPREGSCPDGQAYVCDQTAECELINCRCAPAIDIGWPGGPKPIETPN